MTKKKRNILAASYTAAAFIALGACAIAGHNGLTGYRTAAEYSSGRAFEETVRSVEAMSKALEKSVYATDGGMCGLICGEVYADALAAESALATLPFSTQELEQTSAFLNVAGDYAYTLCGQAAENGFTEEQINDLSLLSSRAAKLAQTLDELRGQLNDGSLIMDSREQRLQNVGGEDGEKLSAKLLEYEAGLEPAQPMEYDGQYGKAKKDISMGGLSQDEQMRLAAQCAGVEPEELKAAYEYSGDQALQSYWAADALVTVGPQGVVSMARSRLVDSKSIEPEQAAQNAADWLAGLGYEGVEPAGSRTDGGLYTIRFCKVENDALCLDNCLTVSVALDDGSIYAFSAADYDPEDSGSAFDLSQEDAEATLPDSLRLQDSRKVVIRSAGDQDQACYELSCLNGEDKPVKIYVDASTGKQRRIEL